MSAVRALFRKDPVPSNPRVEFRQIRNRLRERIEEKQYFKDKPACFCPDPEARNILANSPNDVRYLFRLAAAVNQAKWESKVADRLFSFITGQDDERYACAKILAILICINVEPDQDAWLQFIVICRAAIDHRATSEGQESELDSFRDSKLPFTRDYIDQHLSAECATSFIAEQDKFCAVVIEQGARYKTPGKYQRLPYIEETKIGQGSFGQVFRTCVAEGHWHTDDFVNEKGKVYARKDIYFEEGATEKTEWDIAMRFREQRESNHNVAETLAMLCFDDHISIFSDLADCDLGLLLRGHEISRGKSRPSGTYLTLPPSFVTGEPREYETNPTKPPSLFEERLSLLRRVLDLAGAVAYLHGHMKDPDDRMRISCIHQDLKVGNVLVYGNNFRNMIFKISDFSISRIEKGEAHHHINDLFKQRRSQGDVSSSSQTVDPRGILTVNRGNTANESIAPEATVNEGKVNTSADVWSLGTVLCLVLVWLFDEPSGLWNFDKARYGVDKSDQFFTTQTSQPAETSETPFYTRGNSVFTCKKEVGEWFAAMAKRLADKGDIKGSKLCTSMWNYLRIFMLHVDPGERTRMEDAKDQLFDATRGVTFRNRSSTNRSSAVHQRDYTSPPEEAVNAKPFQILSDTSQKIITSIREISRRGQLSKQPLMVFYKLSLAIGGTATDGMISPTGDCLAFRSSRKDNLYFFRLVAPRPYRTAEVLQFPAPGGESWGAWCIGSDYICASKANKARLKSSSTGSNIRAVQLAISAEPADSAYIACIVECSGNGNRRTLHVYYRQLREHTNTSRSSAMSSDTHGWMQLSFPQRNSPKSGDVLELSFSPDRQYLVLSSRSAVFIWPLAEQPVVQCLPIQDEVNPTRELHQRQEVTVANDEFRDVTTSLWIQ